MRIERKDDVTVYKIDWKDLITILIRNIVSHTEKHHLEVLKVKHADDRIESMYFPMKDDTQADIYNKIVPGTSITANMLSYLMFNRFQMSTPAYREAKKLF